jgi:DNA-binding transcriptional ArsR family regulator
MAQDMPSPQALEEISQFFRLPAEPNRLQLLFKLRQGPLDVASERDGGRLLHRAEGQLVDDLRLLVQTRLRQRLEAQLESLAVP